MLALAVILDPGVSRAGSDLWLARAQHQVTRLEYNPSKSEQGLQAPNRAHNLRIFFDSAGIRVHDRTTRHSPSLLRISFARIGRIPQLVEPPTGTLSTHGDRVEIRRHGIVEWYENSERGLEQGFTIAERPAATLAGDLILDLAVAGARVSRSGEEISLATESGRRLSYGNLSVSDATGRCLDAHLETAESERIRLVVDDASAIYPITIDPLLTGTADMQLESDQAAAQMGYSVASAGDVNGDGYGDVIVGAPSYDAGDTDEGAAFIFLGSANGVANGSPANASAMLESRQPGASWGQSVASAGDVNGDGYSDVIVGAPGYNAGQEAEGAAFVFLGSASGITNCCPGGAHALLESNQSSAQMGWSVASAGDVNGDGYADVVVGAPGFSDGQEVEGATFVFLGSASGIASGSPSTAHAQLESDQPVAFLGVSVASAGDVNGDGYSDVIVGAYNYSSGEVSEGAAFVFLGSAAGIASGTPATAHARLEADQPFALLGESVATAGDVNGDGFSDVIIGAGAYDAGQLNEGAAFLFLGSAGGISGGSPATAYAQLESNQAAANFGRNVATAGDLNGDGFSDVVISADGYDGGQTDEGAAFVFLGSASGITDGSIAGAFARFESNQAFAFLGRSAASAGDVNGDGYSDLIIGANGFDSGQNAEGAAFIYVGSASGIAHASTATAHTRIESNHSYARSGASVSSAGDVNGDGFADLIVGAPNYSSGEPSEGAAFVFLGSASGIGNGSPATAHARLESNQSYARLGSSVASAGDVNGDGYGDVIVGAPDYRVNGEIVGAAFVFLGSPAGIANGSPVTAQAQLVSDQVGAAMGTSVASAGDVNGDGFADVIVGAPGFYVDQPGLGGGGAFVFLGSASGIGKMGSPATAHARLVSDRPGASLGESVASAGDVNGDGYADVIVGAPDSDAGRPAGGAVFVFHGSASGILSASSAAAHSRLVSDQLGASMGASVASAGDLDGNGYADVIVGVPHSNASQTDGGAAFVFRGSASGIPSGGPAYAHALLVSSYVGTSMGASVASAGDVNGDGFADVIVGAPDYISAQANGGAAFLFLGSAAGMANGNTDNAPARLLSDQAIGEMGYSVASAGDVNGDGFADVIVGAPALDIGQSAEGAAFVFLANSFGRPALARQWSLGGGGPVQPWGRSREAAGFDVSLIGTHPSGRGFVKLEVEACPMGVRFFGPGCVRRVSPSWTETPASSGGVVLMSTISGLAERALYRWRARVLNAPTGTARTGVTPPPNPSHGPWRRVSAQAVEADIRTGSNDLDGDGTPNDTDLDDDDDGLLDTLETGTGDYVSATNTGTDPLSPDSDGDGFWDGWEVGAGFDPNDSSSSPNNPTSSEQFFQRPIDNQAIQAQDRPKYRWLQSPTGFSLDGSAPVPLSLPLNGGTCTMSIQSTTTILMSYGFPPSPPSPPASGFECCAWQSKCELTCNIPTCRGGELCPSVEPPAGCPVGTICVTAGLVNQAEFDAEETRLRNLGVPACCFESEGAAIFRWGTRAGEAPAYNPSDTDVYPDQCDNCPAQTNADQLDSDTDDRGNVCDWADNDEHQCSDVNADHYDDCCSGRFDPTNHVGCPEPSAVAALAASILLLALLVRRRTRDHGTMAVRLCKR